MGWNSGGTLLTEILQAYNDHIDNSTEGMFDYIDSFIDEIQFFWKLIKLFEDEDCDVIEESLGHNYLFDIAWNTHILATGRASANDYEHGELLDMIDQAAIDRLIDNHKETMGKR